MTVDSGSIRTMVEDFWRDFLASAQSDPNGSRQMLENFDARIDSIASSMPPEDAHNFQNLVEEERDALFQEYRRSPDALKVRLGVLGPPPSRANDISAQDHQAIIRAVQSDYLDLQVIARGPGSLHDRSVKVDRELEVRVRSYIAGMSMEDQAEFSRVYNEEYNRLVMTRLSERKSQSGCVVVMAVGIGVIGLIGLTGYGFIVA